MRGVLTDDALIQAARKRILRELQAEHAAHQISNTINNNQNGGSGGGLMEAMNTPSPDLQNYLIDIEKHDIPSDDPGGKPKGWKKTVRRHVEAPGK